ncbi:MAG: hypothetical protein JWM87_1712 [Candidatus Eremiobacteraeota bacterium]|nr:hypothetical protein [Candidatus Eremiobacteraeota bacterium]
MVCMETWETIRVRCRRDARKDQSGGTLGRRPIRCVNICGGTGRPSFAAPARRKLLDRYVSHIDELIRSTPKITAVRVGSYLRQNVDADLQVNERTLREFVAARRRVLVPKEAFIRAAYAPGDQSQFDFSPMSVLLAGILVVVQLFVVRLSYSGRFIACASMRCDQLSLFEGLLVAFGGLPRSSIFDTSTAVRNILRGRRREENEAFAAFRGGLALNVTFAAPAKGNDKSGVEGVHGYIEDNFFRPIPSFAELDELNASTCRVLRRLSLTRAHDAPRDDWRAVRARAAGSAAAAGCRRACRGLASRDTRASTSSDE